MIYDCAINPDPTGHLNGLAACWPLGLCHPTIHEIEHFTSRNLRSYSIADEEWHLMSAAGDDSTIDEDESGRLRLDIIGKFSASVDERAFSLSRKAQALLAYMILTSSRQLPRTKFIGLLWSEKEDPLAKGSLRQSLSQIQRE